MSNSKTFEINRRFALKGVGATLALPFLEIMSPFSESFGAPAEGNMLRFAAFFMPNGVDHSRFTPSGKSLSKLPPILQPLEGLEDYVNVITDLKNAEGRHSAGTSSFLTGQYVKKTGKANEVNVKNGSIDQLIGQALKETSVFPSLELATHTPLSGVAPSGHSQIYRSFISWRNASTPVPSEINPRRAFDRMFKNAKTTLSGNGSRGATMPNPDASVLDIVLGDARDLKSRLGRSDKQKLDEYFTAIREVEDRIKNQVSAHKFQGITPEMLEEIKGTGQKIKGAIKKGGGGSYRTVPDIPYQQHIRLQLDVMALALWSNTTRSATFMFGDGLNNRNMSFLDGVSGSHHSISHHGRKKDALKMFSLVNTFFVGEYAYFLNRLRSMKEGDGNVLDNSLVLFGTNLSNGQSHSGKNVPAILSGRAGGKIRGNRHIKAGGQPMANLHRSILAEMGVDAEIKGGNAQLRGL